MKNHPLIFGLWLTILLSPAAVKAQICNDSIIASAPAGKFMIHNDGTATHHSTGLMWMRCSLGQRWAGKTCIDAAASLTWQNALQAAENFTFAGHTDWRLPNKNELTSILEERCYTPAIDAVVFPGTPSVYFWSSSPYAGLSHGAWSVDFGYGSVNASVKTGSIAVRLVRDGR